MKERENVRMPFGKWKHTAVADLPNDYVKWCYQQDWITEPLRSALAEEYRHRFVRVKTVNRDEVVEFALRIVTAGYRQLAKAYHPDTGLPTARHEDQVRLNNSYDWLKKRVAA